MAKRVADYQLTHDNWDEKIPEPELDDDEPHVASPEVLKTRKIATAHRRIAGRPPIGGGGGVQSTGGANPTFRGFSFVRTTTAASSQPFASMASYTSGSQQQTTGRAGLESKAQDKRENGAAEKKKEELKKPVNEKAAKERAYASEIIALNKCFFDHWVKHMKVSPYKDFSSACREYMKYMEALDVKYNGEEDLDDDEEEDMDKDKEEEKKKDKEEAQNKPPTLTVTAAPAEAPKMSFPLLGSSSVFNLNKNNSITDPDPGIKPIPNVANTTQSPFQSSTSQVIQTPNNSQSSVDTGIGSASSSQTVTAERPTADEAGDEEEYVPPKPEVIELKEENSVYDVKCKLFYKSDNQWLDKGLGRLFIKTSGEGPSQLLIRTETATSNILLNIALASSMPVNLAKDGKGVLISCIPNPPIEDKKKGKDKEEDDKKVGMFLIRVKAEEAKNLFEAINDNKKDKD